MLRRAVAARVCLPLCMLLLHFFVVVLLVSVLGFFLLLLHPTPLVLSYWCLFLLSTLLCLFNVHSCFCS